MPVEPGAAANLNPQKPRQYPGESAATRYEAIWLRPRRVASTCAVLLNMDPHPESKLPHQDDSEGDIEMSAMDEIPVTPAPIEYSRDDDSDDESDGEDSGSRALLGSDHPRERHQNRLWPQIQGIVVEVSTQVKIYFYI